MTKEEIIENNKLIAEFLGYQYLGNNDSVFQPLGWKKSDKQMSPKIMEIGEIGKRHYLCRLHRELQFHSSYDWLIPVCKKIEVIFDELDKSELVFKTKSLNNDYVKILNEWDLKNICGTDIHSLYSTAVKAVKFIDLYNNQININ